jgi:hypothetical protein
VVRERRVDAHLLVVARQPFAPTLLARAIGGRRRVAEKIEIEPARASTNPIERGAQLLETQLRAGQGARGRPLRSR